MDDETFLAYVINNAPRYEIETLEKIVRSLNNNIRSRRWGKPPGLEIGSNVEATEFDGGFRWYGTVIRLTPQGCVIEPPHAKYSHRISFKKYLVRVLDEFEWNRVSAALSERERHFEEQTARQNADQEAEREEAIRGRGKAAPRPRSMQALNGRVDLYRGAFVHAYRPDWGSHEYGVLVEMTPKNILLSTPESTRTSRVSLAKHDVHVLSDAQWQIVDAELRRRRTEYEAAEKAGKSADLPDYSMVEIPLELAAHQ